LAGQHVNYSTAWPAALAAYDTNGDLFVDGPPYGTIAVGQLPKGAQSVENVSLNRGLGHEYPGGLQWYGGHLVIAHFGPQDYGCWGRLYRFRLKGISGKHAGSYRTRTDLADFFI